MNPAPPRTGSTPDAAAWSPAATPPGLDPSWSRTVTADDAEGVGRRWHLLDSHAGAPEEETAGLPTLVCVHGNPTWSYLWRGLLATRPDGWRVVAPDQLGMGFSEPASGTLSSPRRLAQRITDLQRLTERLGLTGPVVAVGHDWGGLVVSGWALQQPGLAGLVLANTAVWQDPSTPFSTLIRLARHPGLIASVCVRTPTFLRAAAALSRPALDAGVRAGLALPYRRAVDRRRIGQFVADVPLEPDHPTRPTLDALAAGVAGLDVPGLLLRGVGDPVFTEAHLADLHTRMPHADVHRYEGASHLVTEDRPEYAATVWDWVVARRVGLAVHGAGGALGSAGQAQDVTDGTVTGAPDGSSQSEPGRGASDETVSAPPSGSVRTGRGRGVAGPSTNSGQADVPNSSEERGGGSAGRGPGSSGPTRGPDQQAPDRSLPWWRQQARATDPATAVVEVVSGREISFAALEEEIVATARGLHAIGLRPGQRVAVLVPPGIDLTVLAYACWRVGAVIVVADAGLGLRSLGRALRGARPDLLVAIPAGALAARALRVPGRPVLVGRLPAALRRRLGVRHDLDSLQALGRDSDTDLEAVRAQALDPDGDADCAVLFTSGATGPSKGVVYRLSQIGAQVEVLRETMGIGDDDRFVAAFAPFALYGPALGVPAAVPDMDVTAPATLTATALAEAVDRLSATVVFASPAALVNVLETADGLGAGHRQALGGVRHLMSAGAPVPVGLLRRLTALLPAAELHTPYGMTEALPVTDITLAEIERAGTGDGVCVGRPRPGVTVRISPLPEVVDDPDGVLVDAVGVLGEICVHSGHVKDRYDRLWATERAATPAHRWHRTGDVGHLDADGRLWVRGRRVHVVHTADGPVTPVGIEQRVEQLAGVRQACVAAVGPVGTQQVVLVLVPQGAAPGRVLAGADLTGAVRRAAGVPVAAVLCVQALPLDIRHQSKIDRVAVGRWAEGVLAGRRPGRLARRLPRRGRGRRR